jgi:hypothetical protein
MDDFVIENGWQENRDFLMGSADVWYFRTR